MKRTGSQECILDNTLVDLPPTGIRRLAVLLGRAVQLRCPLCGSRSIFDHPWSLKVCCPTCGYTFVQEDGYFLGGYLINLVVAEVIGLGAILVILLRSDLSVGWQQVIAISAAILLPVLFYPFSRTFWMAFDHMARRDMNQVNIRGGDMP